MSETQIINRTPETFGQKIERERLEAETAQVVKEEQIETLIAQVAATVSNTPSAGSPNWIGPGAESVLTQEAKTELADDIGNRAEAPQASLMDVLKDYRTHGPRDPDLRDFRLQVIAAFKHLGLDTRKFFEV